MHVHIRCRRVLDSLIPLDTASAYAVKAWPTNVIDVELQDAKRMHTRQQEKFWFGVVVPMIMECWRHEKDWAVAPSKEVVHGAVVRAVFGEIQTPLGPERRSSKNLTLEEYSQLIDWARDYLWTKYKLVMPEPGE